MQIPRELAKFGLVPARKPERRGLVLMMYGSPGTGKSDLMLRSAPRPLLCVDFDLNLSVIAERHVEDEGLLFKQFILPRKLNQEKDGIIWAEFRDLYQTALGSGYFRSVMIDGGDNLYELVRRNRLGVLDFGEAPRAAFSSCNSDMRWIFSYARARSINLAFVCRDKESFIEGVSSTTGKRTAKSSGERKPAGWSDAVFEAQMVIRMFKDKASEDGWVNRFHAEVIKCNASPDLEGGILTGNEITFQNLAVLSNPLSSAEEWR